MKIFKRLFRIGQAEIHSAIDKMEDPVKMTEQGLRELKEDIAKATEAYAQVKALAIRTQNEQEKAIKEANSYGEKAVLILQKAQRQELDTSKAEELAKEALTLKRNLTEEGLRLDEQAKLHAQTSLDMLNNIQILQENLTKWERELKTIRARAKVSDATILVNKQLAQIDGDNTLSMLERMKNKVEEQESLATAYGEIGRAKNEKKSAIDEYINNENLSVDMEFEELKKNLGL